MQKLFFRCNGGDNFMARRAQGCPFDGWFEPPLNDVIRIFETLSRTDDALSVAKLRDAGAPEDVLHRVLIIDFGSAAACFAALSPGYYFHDGAIIPFGDGLVPLELL